MNNSVRRAISVARIDLLFPQSRALIVTWALITILLGYATSIGAVQIQSGSSGIGGVKAYLTSEFAQALQCALIAIIIDGFFFAVLAGMSVPRDHESRVLDIERSCGLTSGPYVVGKFTGATVWLLIMLFLQILSRIVFNHIVPDADMDESRGPFHFVNYFRPMLMLVLPGLLFNGAIAFFLGARFRNSVIVFLSPIALILAYGFIFSETLLNKLPEQTREIIRLADPSGTEWLSQKYLRDDRGAAFYNNTPIEYDTAYLLSRVALIVISIGLIVLSSPRSMGESIGRIRANKRQKNLLDSSNQIDTGIYRPAKIDLAGLEMQFRRPSWSAIAFAVARNEIAALVRGPGLWLFAIIIAIIASINAVLQPGPLDTTILVTSGNFAARSFTFVTFCTVLLALFFGTDAMERDRVHRVDSFIFSSPISTAAWLFGKALACSLAGLAVVLASFVGLCVALVWQREILPEIQPLLIIWGLLLIPTFFFWSSVIALIRAFTPNRAAALGLGMLVIALTIYSNIRGYNNWAVNWALNGPTVIWSDISRFEAQRTALVANRINTTLAGICLLAFASIRLRRMDVDLIALKSRRKFSALIKQYAPALIALLPCIILGTWVYAQVRTGPQGAVIRKQNRDYWRRNVATFFDFKSPTIDETVIDIQIKPESHSFSLSGSYLIRNHQEKPIREFPITLGHHLKNIKWLMNDQAYKPEDRSGLIIIKKVDGTELKPGEQMKLGFQYDGQYPGGMSRVGTGGMEFIMPSGVVLTSFSQSFLPKLGFDGTRGLDPEMQPEGKSYPDDFYRQKVDPAIGDGSKMKTSVAVTVPSDFHANSVGVLESVTDQPDGTKKFIWKSDHPVSFFNIVAGRWVQARGEGVTIYHDARHGRNVPEMLRALEGSRKYYSQWFGEFPWKELKLSEFPGLADYAQGFPTNITFSESIGFRTLSRADSNVAFYVTAHEAAHQWWGNLLVPGAGPGGNILSESLANYSAIILMDQVMGEQARIGLTKQIEMDYIMKRQGDDERPLTKIDGTRDTDQSITYSRGGMVFWMLSNLMGRENFNKGLAEMIRRFPAGTADAPLVEDLLETIRPFAPDKMQYDQFAAEWIKGSALPNLFLDDIAKSASADQSWLVKGKLRNDGTSTIEIEIAATKGERFPEKDTESAEKTAFQQARTKLRLGPNASADFEIKCNFEPDQIVADPDFKQLLRGRDRLEKKL